MPYINGKKVLAAVRVKYLDLDDVYPIGSVYISFNSTSPAQLFGGTWERVSSTFLYGTSDNNAIGQTGGEATHILTKNEMPSHTHNLYNNATGNKIGGEIGGVSGYDYIEVTTRSINSEIVTTSEGSGQAHNNMPPFTRVAIWKRIADPQEE